MSSVAAAVGSRLSSLYASKKPKSTGGSKPSATPARIIVVVNQLINSPDQDYIYKVYDLATTSTTLDQALCTAQPLTTSAYSYDLPTSMGPLSLHGHTACNYQAPFLPRKVGSIVCENGYTASCATMTDFNLDCSSTKTYHTLLYPQFTCAYA